MSASNGTAIEPGGVRLDIAIVLVTAQYMEVQNVVYHFCGHI